jgi:hypothetical protein
MTTFWFPFLLVPIFIGLCFITVFGGIIYVIVRAIGQASYNNSQPILSTAAAIVAKRTSTRGGGNETMVSTTNYVTFETQNGVRREFSVGGKEYGLLVEGDQGTLSSQRTRYKGFQRRIS